MTLFAIIVIGEEVARSDVNFARDGERYWVENEEWIDATGARFDWRPDGTASPQLKTFSTAAAAEAFAKKWKGHPWWVKPKSHEIVAVEPLYETITGYKIAEAADGQPGK